MGWESETESERKKRCGEKDKQSERGERQTGSGRATGGREKQNLVGCAPGTGEGLAQSARLWGVAQAEPLPRGRRSGAERGQVSNLQGNAGSLSAGGRESRGTHTARWGERREDCRGEDESKDGKAASGRGGVWEGDLGLGLLRRQPFRGRWRGGGEKEGERGTGGGPHQNYLIK